MLTSRGRSADTHSSQLGRRIRDARLALGLTQGELAGTEYSVGFISRLESGARQPSRHTLTALATRLGVSVDYLLTGAEQSQLLSLRYDVDAAELALAGGDIDQARTLTETLLEGERLLPWPDLHGRARLVHALMLESSGDTHGAIIELEDLLADTSGGETSATIGIALSRCYREVGDFAQAITAGERVLASLDEIGLAGTTEHIRLSMTVAMAYFESGELGVATRMARRAIKAAEASASPEAQAAAYWNASMFEQAAGRMDQAVAMAARALSILENGNSTRNLARLRKQLALIQLSVPDADLGEIHGLLEQSGRELAWSSASPVDVARHTYAAARLALREGDPDQALTLLAQVPAEVCHQDPMLSAEVSMLKVVSLTMRGESAVQAYTDTATLLDLIGAERGAAQVWFGLGEAMDSAGNVEQARQAYRRAAECLGAAGMLMPVSDRPTFRLPTTT